MGRRRTNPFRGFTDFMSEMNRARDLGRRGSETGHEDRQRTYATAWVPTADIFAKGEDLVIRIELPGVRREDIDIALSGGVLAVSGERRSDINEEEVSFYTRERFYGTFSRSMNLPEGVDEGRISATFEDCVLELIVQGALAPALTMEPRRIQIRDRSGQARSGS
jgi:HSP20 family protein